MSTETLATTKVKIEGVSATRYLTPFFIISRKKREKCKKNIQNSKVLISPTRMDKIC